MAKWCFGMDYDRSVLNRNLEQLGVESRIVSEEPTLWRPKKEKGHANMLLLLLFKRTVGILTQQAAPLAQEEASNNQPPCHGSY
jgi:hypothetical protein